MHLGALADADIFVGIPDVGLRPITDARPMTPLARVMGVVLIGTCCVGVAAWLYGTWYWFRDWKGDHGREFKRKFTVSCAIFLLALATGFASGTIAEVWGGGWH